MWNDSQGLHCELQQSRSILDRIQKTSSLITLECCRRQRLKNSAVLQNTERRICCDQPECEGAWKVMDALSHGVLFPCFFFGFLSGSNFHLSDCTLMYPNCLSAVLCVLYFTLFADLTFYGTVLSSDPQFTKLWFNKTLHILCAAGSAWIKALQRLRYYNCDWPQNHRSSASRHTSLGHNSNKKKWHFELVIHLWLVVHFCTRCLWNFQTCDLNISERTAVWVTDYRTEHSPSASLSLIFSCRLWW